jgi:arginase family enzyme
LVISGAAGLWDSGLGAGVDLANLVLVGGRDLDPCEQALVDEGRLTLVMAGPDLARRLRDVVANRPVYVHLDCDVLEPGVVPSEYQVPGGLTLSDLDNAAAMLAECELVGLEVAEFEAEWPDGTPGDPKLLVGALVPLLELARLDAA